MQAACFPGLCSSLVPLRLTQVQAEAVHLEVPFVVAQAVWELYGA